MANCMEKKIKPGVDVGLTKDDKATLYAIARTAIECGAVGKKPPALEIKSDILKRIGAPLFHCTGMEI